MIRVVVVDDHTVMRQGLVGLLAGEDDIEVVGQTGDAESAFDLIAATHPDVVLLDVSLPGMRGIEACKIVRERHPDIGILMVTMHDREDYLFEALRAGASGYALKGSDVRELLGAVRVVAGGNSYVPSSMMGSLVKGFVERSDGTEAGARSDGLSDREIDVLRLVAEGLTTAEIGDVLHVSPHTVNSHRDHIMTKLDLHSKVELTRYAIRKGIVELDS